MNTNETAIYHKGKHLYGLNFAKSSQSDRIIIVEGYFDVISLYLAGIDYAAATLGTALTSAQVNLLKGIPIVSLPVLMRIGQVEMPHQKLLRYWKEPE